MDLHVPLCCWDRRAWLSRCFGGALALAFQGPVARAQEAAVYRVGVVPQFDSRTLHDIWTPLLAQLQARTGFHFVLVGSPNIPAFEQQFAQQAFDFMYANPYHALMAANHYVPLVRDTVTLLQGIIVVRKDSPIKDLRGLQGLKVDFPAPNALAASLLTRAHLSAAGVDVQTRYVKTHSSVYLNVALGQADGGGGVLQTFEEQPAAVRDSLRILDKTIKVVSHPVMANHRIPASVRAQVQSAFLALGETAEGRALLQRIPFDQVGVASAADYTPLKRLGLEKFYVAN